jgi:predicted dehydrogenase
MTDPLRIGMLGYGFMGRAHANAIARLPMFAPAAPPTHRHTLIGRDTTALSEAADRLGFTHTATDWRAVVDEVDVFYNLGPNQLHAEPSIAALDAGTAVLCEKPLATTPAAADTMADAAAAATVPAGCGFTYRFVPAIQHAKTLLDRGELGTIRQFRGRYLQDWLVDPDAAWSWRLDSETAGSGALGDLGAHTIDLARFLLGDHAGAIDRVTGTLRTFVDERPVYAPDGETVVDRRPVTVDDAYTAEAVFETGVTATVEASRVAAGHKNDHTIEIHGTEGSLRFSLERLNELEVLTGDSRGYETVLVTEESDPYLEHWWPPGHTLGWEHAVVHENVAFLSAVADDTAFRPSFADGCAVQRVLAAIERAADRETWVAVDDVPAGG